jgi:hypothetical protein
VSIEGANTELANCISLSVSYHERNRQHCHSQHDHYDTEGGLGSEAMMPSLGLLLYSQHDHCDGLGSEATMPSLGLPSTFSAIL